MSARLLLALALSASTCTALQPPAPQPAPDPDPVASAPDPTPTPAPTSQPDPTALQLCLDNFQALNPDVPRDQLEQLFCSGDQLLSWHRQAILKGKP